MAVQMERHSSSSNLPLLTDWLNCSSAAFCTSMGAPPARTASLKASMMSVALPTSCTDGTRRWTPLVMLSSVVGSPLRRSLIFWMAAEASSEL